METARPKFNSPASVLCERAQDQGITPTTWDRDKGALVHIGHNKLRS
jgi:hypothetical protein